MKVRRRWLFSVVVFGSLLLAACGGSATPGTDSSVPAASAPAGSTVVRVKESKSLGTAAQPIDPNAAEGPAGRGAAGPTADVAGVCLNSEEAELARLVNEYRASLNLPPMQVSKSLSLVAQQHIWDSTNNQASWPTAPAGQSCNLHTWTKVVNPALQEGKWTEVCYTSDHANAAGMWNKPRELAGYPADGVENSWATSGTANAAGALLAWKNSPGHNNVITQQGGWGPMAAMGVGVSNGRANLWMSNTADPAGVAQLCPGAALPVPTAEPTAIPPTAVPPTDVPPTAVPPTDVPAATAEQPTVAAATEAPTDVPPTEVPPTAVPPTAVPPTAAAPTGQVFSENGTIAAGGSNVHSFPIFAGRRYTLLVTPSAEFDVAPEFACTLANGGSFSFDFDWDWEGQPESFTFDSPGNSGDNCQLTVSGYQGSTGTYTVEVTAQ